MNEELSELLALLYRLLERLGSQENENAGSVPSVCSPRSNGGRLLNSCRTFIVVSRPLAPAPF
jgi:hypothetical protein